MTSTASAPSQPLVRVAVAAGIATLTLARPEANNAMSAELIEAFTLAAGEVSGDPSVRAILIEAEGKNFCVGGDIRAFVASDDPAPLVGRIARRLHEGMLMLARHPAPVIVAAQGAAAGAGLGLVAAADIVLASASANFSMAYAGIGLTADGGATWLLPRLIGLRRAQEMAYAGRRLTAAEAAEYGLVTRVVEDDALAVEARALAAKIASGPTAAFGAVKRLFQAGDTAAFADQLDAEADSMERAMASADAREGVRAFTERRPPDYTGR